MKGIIKLYVKKLNRKVNEYPLNVKRRGLIVIGLFIAATWSAVIVQAVRHPRDISAPRITQPVIQPNPRFMKDTTETLIPVCKMKGDIDGEFEAFYVALDTAGQLYINHHMPFENPFAKSEDWKPITVEKFREYEKQLHVLPSQGRGRKR